MDNITLRYVYDKNKKATQSKPQPLYVEARINKTNKSIYINTGIKLYPNQFSDKNGFTCKNHDRAVLITRKAKDVFNQVYDFATSKECNSLPDIKNYDKTPGTHRSVVDFIRERLRASNPTTSVLKNHNVLINKIEEFGKFKTFNDLTYQNLVDFDIFLRKTIKSTLIYKRHATFRKYINEAIKFGICEKNPYDNFEIKRGHDKERTFLTESEIKKIQNYNATGKLFHIKDLFIVQCFTGLAYIDLMNLSRDMIEEMDGYKVIRSNRIKTDESFITLLLPEAEEILKRYNYQLPKISNQKYNDYLKLLAAGAGINKEITSHVARHTFATYLLNRNVPIETVSRALGHSNINTTKIYAKMLSKKVISDMSKLISPPNLTT